ncbi:PP2C-like domain-containing protein CG9801 isoform X3 [Rhopilema esculentum]|uniref:PP2C-like domain-containing protein CG9801 isoform X3 n=1 Tax=Rhopilema esculentum TaxID=499914 RepID=UPI0031DEAC7C
MKFMAFARTSVEVEEDEKQGNSLFDRLKRGLFNTRNTSIKFGKHISDVPNKKISKIDTNVTYAYDAPEDALWYIHKRRLKRGGNEKSDKTPVANIVNWKRRDEDCYGLVTSLYDKLIDGSGNVGDPVADSLAIVARSNNCILILADGVNWGERSMLASRSSVYGAVTYLLKEGTLDSAQSTKDVFRSILRAFETAQNVIMEEEATLTTLCIGVVVELADKDKWGFCVVNVGDSLAFVYNEQEGVREVTMGSHSVDEKRDMRYSGGALGPADGYNPDLTNLTCAYTSLESGDFVYLTSDGISDNFDPTVGRFPCRRRSSKASPLLQRKNPEEIRYDSEESITRQLKSLGTIDDIVEWNMLSPRERHQGMLNKMRDVIEKEEGPPGALGVCAKFMNFVVSNTQGKRLFLEKNGMAEDDLHKMTSKERKERSLYMKGQLETKSGKLDHASIAAFRVGRLNPQPLKRVLSAASNESFEILNHELDGYSSIYSAVNQEPSSSNYQPEPDTLEQVNKPRVRPILYNLHYESSI